MAINIPYKSMSAGGIGDMTRSVYDPQLIEADAFDRGNHTGTQGIVTINGLQLALDNKEDLGAAAAAVAAHVAESDPHTQYALSADLATVATSGLYSDLSGTPTPGVYDFPQEKFSSLGGLSGAVTINITDGSLQKFFLTGPLTLSFDFLAVGSLRHSAVILRIVNGGQFAITWSDVKWDGGVAPTLTAIGRDRVVISYDQEVFIGTVINEGYQ